MAVNRTRNKAITLRMTAEELALFQSQFEKSEAKNQTDFVLQLLDEKPIVVNHELSEVLAELKRQGNNLNQIAKQLNRTGCRLELIDAVIEIRQLSCGDEFNALTDLGQQAVLDLIDKVGDIAVVRIERAARKASALGERRDVNARKVAAFGKFAGKRLAKGTL